MLKCESGVHQNRSVATAAAELTPSKPDRRALFILRLGVASGGVFKVFAGIRQSSLELGDAGSKRSHHARKTVAEQQQNDGRDNQQLEVARHAKECKQWRHCYALAQEEGGKKTWRDANKRRKRAGAQGGFTGTSMLRYPSAGEAQRPSITIYCIRRFPPVKSAAQKARMSQEALSTTGLPRPSQERRSRLTPQPGPPARGLGQRAALAGVASGKRGATAPHLAPTLKRLKVAEDH